uniref:FAM194 domain-containing protein n=1 Tax=Macrostomum lignano TaxID=282301 RepID=A0A1I8JLR2_9PLAT
MDQECLVQGISDPVSAVMKGFDGRELSIMSLATQTEWSWIEDMRLRQQSDQQSVKSEPGNAESGRKEADVIEVQSGAGGSSQRKRGGPRSSRSSMRSGRSGGSSQSGRLGRSRAGGLTIPAYPEPRVDDEFGVLLVQDDDSDLSDTNVKGDSLVNSGSSKNAGLETVDTAEAVGVADEGPAADNGLLPSVGPPQILQIPVEEAFPGLSLDLGAVSMREGDSCDFCGRPIQALPSREDQASRSPEQLYCCAEFRKLLEFALQYQTRLLHQQQQTESGLIDVAPHPHFGSRGKKSAQERERMREEAEKRRKLLQQERQRRAAEAAQATAQVGRQMRTINYSLSSMRCLEEGWTLRAPSPLGDGVSEWQIYDFDMDEITDLAAGLGITPRISWRSSTPTGRSFVTMFADRTGNVFYPSGRLAILISRPADRPNNLLHIVLDDKPPGRARLLGVFDNIGRGTAYFRDGGIRINYDRFNGLDLDQQGSKKRHWHWHSTGQPAAQAPHIHAPPFQPISLALNKTVGLRLAARDSIYLSFVTASRSCKINVGARIKVRFISCI